MALAATVAAAQVEEDLPGRAGRLADVGGQVYLATGERAEDWVEALRNYTVTTGDNLWVSQDGRAEIDYGGGQVRLAGDTNVHIARLDDRILSLFLAQGRVIVRVRVLAPGEAVRVDTPNTQVTLTRPGLYRVEVAPDRAQTEVVVREGEALAQFASGTQQVLPGQTATLLGAEPGQAEVRTGFWVDGFDAWSAERDRRYERSRAANYVSPQMVGYVDLDEYGRWDSVPEYGAIWYPTTVAAGWAPYRYGRWSWVGGWGWTWVDDAPWGYAPFHYGRWAYVGGRWGWCPGGYVARPVWSPAMVAWYGGGGWSISASFGAPVYGWVPLGWGEPYMPWWRGCSDRCWTMYNRPYAVRYAERPHAPPTRYVNWSAPGGVTAVAGATFTGRQPVHRNLVDVRPQAVHSAPMLVRAPTVAKPTAATIPGARPSTAAGPPPPASRFYRTKPFEAAPGGSAIPRSEAGYQGRTRGDPAAPPPRTGAPGTAAPSPRASTRTPSIQQPTERSPQAGTYSPRGSGTPSAPARGGASVSPGPSEPRGPQPAQAPRHETRGVPPSSGAPGSRYGPPPPSTPGVRATPPSAVPPPAASPRTAPSPSAGTPAQPMQRGASPAPPAPVQRGASPAPPAPVQRGASPTPPEPVQRGASPAPPAQQRSGGDDRQGDKPASRREVQKSDERQ